MPTECPSGQRPKGDRAALFSFALLIVAPSWLSRPRHRLTQGKSSKPVYSFLSAICDDSWTATIKSLARAPVVRTQLVASALRQYLPQWTRLVDASLRIGAATRARTKATFDEVLRAVPVSDVLSFAGGLHHSVAYALPGSGAGLQLQQEPQQQLEQVSDEEQLRLRAVRRQEAIEAALQAEATMIARAHEEDIQVATQMSIEEQLSRPPEEVRITPATPRQILLHSERVDEGDARHCVQLFPGDSDADYAAVLELSRREAEQAQPHLPPATGAVSVGTLNLDFKTVPLAADDAGFHSARTNGTGFESARSKLNPGLYSARSTASSLKIPSQPKAEPRARSSSEAPLYSARSTAESLKTPSRQVSAQKSAAGPSARSSAEAPLYSARSTASSVKAPNRQESASAQRAAGPRARNSQEAPAPAYMPPWFQEGGTDKFHDAEDVELKLEAVSSSPRVVARSSTREIQPASDEEEVFLSGSDDDFKSVRIACACSPCHDHEQVRSVCSVSQRAGRIALRMCAGTLPSDGSIEYAISQVPPHGGEPLHPGRLL